MISASFESKSGLTDVGIGNASDQALIFLQILSSDLLCRNLFLCLWIGRIFCLGFRFPIQDLSFHIFEDNLYIIFLRFKHLIEQFSVALSFVSGVSLTYRSSVMVVPGLFVGDFSEYDWKVSLYFPFQGYYPFPMHDCNSSAIPHLSWLFHDSFL